MKSQHLTLGLTAILVTSAVAIGSHAGFSGKRSQLPAKTLTETAQPQLPVANASQAKTQPQTEQTAEIPTHIVYGLLFREMAAFRQKAQELRDKGKDASFLEGFHVKRARLNDAKASAAFETIARECQSKVEEIELQAKKIIDKDRALHPGGRILPGESLPEPPKQLRALEKQRLAVLMQAREQLRLAIGDSEFQRFEEFEARDVAERSKSVGRPPHSIAPPTNGFKPRP